VCEHIALSTREGIDQAFADVAPGPQLRDLRINGSFVILPPPLGSAFGLPALAAGSTVGPSACKAQSAMAAIPMIVPSRVDNFTGKASQKCEPHHKIGTGSPGDGALPAVSWTTPSSHLSDDEQQQYSVAGTGHPP
jgi:hypothetical protein